MKCGGGGPSAEATSLVLCANNTSSSGAMLLASTRMPRPPPPRRGWPGCSGNGGTSKRRRMSSTKFLCSSSIRSRSSSRSRPPSSEPANFCGTSRSTPNGLPLTSASIQLRSMSSCSGEWATAPSTPHPPALVTAATTSRQWLKAKIGTSMPTRSVAAVRMRSAYQVGGRIRRSARRSATSVGNRPSLAASARTDWVVSKIAIVLARASSSE